MTNDTVKKLMYGNKNNNMKKFTEKAAIIKEKAISRDSVLLEIDGKKHHVVTHVAYTELLKEHKNTKNDLRKTQSDILKLTETIKKLDRDLKMVEVMLASKIDRYDD